MMQQQGQPQQQWSGQQQPGQPAIMQQQQWNPQNQQMMPQVSNIQIHQLIKSG